MTVRQRFVAFRSGWGYIILLTVVTAGWIGWNLSPWLPRFDAPPFLYLGLLLSIEAAYAMPVLLMEQFKHEAEDRALLKAGLDADRGIALQVKAVLAAIDELEREENDGR